MQIIWKYAIPTNKSTFSLEIPFDSQILTMDFQNEKPFLWILVETKKIKIMRSFFLVGTGWDVDEQRYGIEGETKIVHIKTWQVGRLVWHLFEEI